MPRVVWSGSLSFGLVNVPVRLVNATEPKDIRFHLFDREGRRVRYERVVDRLDEPARAEPPSRGEPATRARSAEALAPQAPDVRQTPDRPQPAAVAWDEVQRGWENEIGEVVLLSREDIEHVRPHRSRTIDVEDFVDLGDIDPVFFEKTYHAIPQSLEAARPYAVLHAAMREAGRVGIGRFVLRTKPHLVAVRPMRDVLAVETLFFGDEVRDPAAPVSGPGPRVDERELALATQLIEMMTTEWDPAAYGDTYREDLLRLLTEKVPTPAASAPREHPAEGPSAVEQLMTALKGSVEAAKARQKQGPRSRSTRAG